MSKIYRSAMITAGIGLLLLFCVILSGVAYPHWFFTAGTLAGMMCIFASLLLFFISWMREMYDTVKGRQYGLALVIALCGIAVVAKALMRIF